MSDEAAAEAEAGSTPVEDPEPDVLEAPSDEPDEPQDGEEDEDAEASAAEPPTDAEPQPDDGEDAAWKNFTKKFEHIKDDRDRRAAMGRAWWEKTRFSSSVRKENERLKGELAEMRGRTAKPDDKPDEPPAPPADVQKLDLRIKALYEEDQGLQSQYNETLSKLAEAGEAVAKLQGKLEDVEKDDPRYEQLSTRIEVAEGRKQTVLADLRRLTSDRKRVNSEMERLLPERDFAAKYHSEAQRTQAQQKQDREKAEREFPKFVDGLASKLATDAKVPDDPKIRGRLARYVRTGIRADLASLVHRGGDPNLDDVDFGKLVKTHVDAFVEDFDLAGRMRFAERSKDKLKVASRPASPAGGPAASATKPAIPVSRMPAAQTTPGMAKAREYLRSRGL